MVKIGIVGVGGIATGVHIPGIQSSDQGKVTAICDINPARLQEVGEKLGIPEALRFIDYHDLIACPEVEAVEICTPNYLHVEIACAAAEAGKPFNCEKPLSIDFETVKPLIETLKSHPVPNMMCFSYRFMPAVRYAKWIMEQKLIGNVVNIEVKYLKSSGFWEGRRLDWRFVKKYAGTGVLGDLGVHLIDMTRFLVGDIHAVCGVKKTVVKQRQREDSDEWAPVETDDYCSFLAEMDDEICATFLISRCIQGHDNTVAFSIYGDQGVISFDLNHTEQLDVCIGKVDIQGKGLHTVTVPAKFKLPQEQMFVNLVSGRETPYLPTVEDGIQCQKILDALLLSSEERRWVDIE